MSEVKNKLWGGAFSKSMNETAWRFGQSIYSDLNLLQEEIDVSIAHTRMLGKCGLLSNEEAITLITALEKISPAILEQPELISQSEDLHGAIETMLFESVGELAGKLHAGRSRNDQIATASKLWLKRKYFSIAQEIRRFQKVLIELAEKHLHDPMPGYTHQQPAQPVTLGFHLLTYFWMLERDWKRIEASLKIVDDCPLGAAALAGTSLPIERNQTSLELGFSRPMPNASDAVSDRDFVSDALHIFATIMQHLSRISQEIVVFSTNEFGYLKLDDAFSTGSSIMPQKRNPDFAELIRGRSARVIGHWTAQMSMMKALPLGYNRDFQEDKPPLFDSASTVQDSLVLVSGMLSTATFNTERMKENASKGDSTVTAIAEALVLQGIPFRKAHERVGLWVQNDHSGDPELDKLLETVGTLEACIENRNSIGATGKTSLANQLNLAKQIITKEIS